MPHHPSSRLRWILAGFIALSLAVLARVVTLELSYGAAYRAEAAKPLNRQQSLPGVRGRILARDGTVLACDQATLALAVHYRYLENPPDPRWLRGQVRSRLSVVERKQPDKLIQEQARWLAERDDLHLRLAQQCGLALADLQARTAAIQRRVERISQRVNETRLEPVVVSEELDYHVVVEQLSLEAITEIEGHADRYPGVRLVPRVARNYPLSSSASHVLGHLGPPERSDESLAYDRVGRMGIECQFERVLRGRAGQLVEQTDHSGRVLSQTRAREPTIGRDLLLTLDLALQQTAESLLDGAIERRTPGTPGGGAVVVMDAHSGALLVAASAPRFDPNAFGSLSGELPELLASDARPLFDRVARMALPPGSVFKTLTAIALLQDGQLDPAEPFDCRGYLHEPDRLRCQLYRRQGVGHGPTTLTEALMRSCNVYFFHHAERLTLHVLPHWAAQFGFGQATGIDLPNEANGQVPAPQTTADVQALAIGQSKLTTTPLQVARLMGAVANGGRLVTPHVVRGLGPTESPTVDTAADKLPEIPPPKAIAGLHRDTLLTIRRGLERVVSDPEGTAHDTVYLEGVSIAGKTGTVETGDRSQDHAWFAGYAPAEAPRLVIVVALENAGDASTAAGPLVKRLVTRLRKLGLL